MHIASATLERGTRRRVRRAPPHLGSRLRSQPGYWAAYHGARPRQVSTQTCVMRRTYRLVRSAIAQAEAQEIGQDGGAK